MYPELEVSFHQRDERIYGVELRFDDPDNQAENFFGPFSIEFDWDRLSQLVQDAHEYGVALSAMFFRDAGIKEAFIFAFATAAQRDALRVRFNLSPTAPRLHEVLWETLEDPSTAAHSPLATSERVLVSRFLSSWDFRPVHLRRKDVLRALVVIANPHGLESQQVEQRALPPIPVDVEWARAKASLGTISATKLAENGEASLDRITASLRDRDGFDIFYLVCHGALVNCEPLLWLEDEKGGIARVNGMDLVIRLKDMLRPPRLVVLASCQSAGVGGQARSDDKGALAALGPKLAEAGITAVIAMQDSIRMDTAGKFFTAFFQELTQDGQIDRAMAVARSAVHPAQPDWWVPVLITRLKRGRIWYEHDVMGEFKHFPSVVRDIATADCTPILGPDLVASLLGSPVDIARRWAERYDFPMEPHERDSLPQVAQYLAYHKSPHFMRTELREHVREFLVHTYSDRLSGTTRSGTKPARLSDLIEVIGKQLRQEDQHDPLRTLAELPFPIYVTTNRDNLLFDALVDAGKQPKLEICRWAVFEKELDDWPKSVFAPDEAPYTPTVNEPLVFHLFGHMSYPETLVLAEDDYFDFLIGVNKNRRRTFGVREPDTGIEPFPQAITRALSKRGLLFLGFRVSDWEFRTLFRNILAQETRRATKDHISVSVQIEPGEGEFLEPQGAHSYIEDYFKKNNALDVYWGSAKDFARQLFDCWQKAGSPEPNEDDQMR